jgi:hypothetical protein
VVLRILSFRAILIVTFLATVGIGAALRLASVGNRHLRGVGAIPREVLSSVHNRARLILIGVVTGLFATFAVTRRTSTLCTAHFLAGISSGCLFHTRHLLQGHGFRRGVASNLYGLDADEKVVHQFCAMQSHT